MQVHEVVQNTVDVNLTKNVHCNFWKDCTARLIVQSNGGDGKLNVRILDMQVSGLVLVPSKRNWENAR